MDLGHVVMLRTKHIASRMLDLPEPLVMALDEGSHSVI
jgi:hypothetical protein